MTISSSINRYSSAGNGVATAFSYNSRFLSDSDLVVVLVVDATGIPTTQVLNTDYTVAGAGESSGGTITMMIAPATGETLVIYGNPPITQGTDWVENDPDPAEVKERAFDKLTLICARLSDLVTRSLRFSDSDTTSADPQLPTPVGNTFIGWDALGTELVNYTAADIGTTPVSVFMATLLPASTAAAARTTLDAQQDVFTTRGDLVRAGAGGVAERVALGASGQVFMSNGTDAVFGDIVQTIPRNYFSGGVMSTAGSSTTMSIAASMVADSTNAVLLSVAALAKTNASWAVGAAGGKSQTGAAANNTWYHFYAIRRPDTGVTDYCFSTNPESTGLVAADFVVGGGNVPNAYTQWRYIGSGLTNGSAQWVKFNQLGDYVYWTTPASDAANATVSTTELQVVTTTPLGVPVIGIFGVFLTNSATKILRLYANADDDLTVSNTNLTLLNGTNSNQNSVTKLVMTDASAQVSWKADSSATGCYLQTLGWIYCRG